MLTGHDVLCFSSIDWDFVWQGHQEIMLRLAKTGNRVLFIENTGVRAPRWRDLPRVRQRMRNWWKGIRGIRKIQDGLYVYSPLVLPFPYARGIRWVNRILMNLVLRSWMQVMGFKRPIAWVFLPTPLTQDLLRNIQPLLTIYYCIDNFVASSAAAQRLAGAEAKLIQKADLVFVTSQALHAHCARWNPRVHDFPFGVDLELFDAISHRQGPLPGDLDALPRPRIGYVGGVHQWIDQRLLSEVARRHAGYSFVLIGPVQTDVSQLKKLSNIHLLGARSHQEVPEYIRGFDVCMIPYQLTEYTRHVYPTKLNEYIALDRPVVSTALPEVEAMAGRVEGSIRIGRQAEEFATQVEVLLRDGGGVDRASRRAIAEEQSWSRKLEHMSQLIEAQLTQRRLDQELHWTERLLARSRRAFRRMSTACVVAALLYGTIFHTPLVWWVASPLKVVEPVSHADVIVVFAGGVGESGRAKQGYEERVKYAVRLYDDGYAPTLLFTSGYTNVFQEAEVMKALAMSLGVPGEAIVLETEAHNTYEYGVRTAETMRAQGQQRALLISSPYHMRRALLVMQAVAPDLSVLATPMPSSEFYGEGRVAWHHLRGILHEYLGILYYWGNGSLRQQGGS